VPKLKTQELCFSWLMRRCIERRRQDEIALKRHELIQRKYTQ